LPNWLCLLAARWLHRFYRIRRGKWLTRALRHLAGSCSDLSNGYYMLYGAGRDRVLSCSTSAIDARHLGGCRDGILGRVGCYRRSRCSRFFVKVFRGPTSISDSSATLITKSSPSQRQTGVFRGAGDFGATWPCGSARINCSARTGPTLLSPEKNIHDPVGRVTRSRYSTVSRENAPVNSVRFRRLFLSHGTVPPLFGSHCTGHCSPFPDDTHGWGSWKPTGRGHIVVIVRKNRATSIGGAADVPGRLLVVFVFFFLLLALRARVARGCEGPFL